MNRKKHIGKKVSRETRNKQSLSHKKFYENKENLQIFLNKKYLTNKLNNSFNISKSEEELYEKLLKENVNKTILRQYKDVVRYPYYCDFYIVEDDLFIELNAHWSHGGHPFNENDENDLKTLEL